MQSNNAQHMADSTAGCWSHFSLSYKTISKLNKMWVTFWRLKMLKMTNKEVLVCLHRVGVLDKGCILHQSQKLDLLMLRISMAAAFLWDILDSAAFNIPWLPPHYEWEILYRLWHHESGLFQRRVFPFIWEWAQLKGGTVHSVLLYSTFCAEVPHCIFKVTCSLTQAVLSAFSVSAKVKINERDKPFTDSIEVELKQLLLVKVYPLIFFSSFC